LKRLTSNLPDGDEQLGERVRSRLAGFRAAKTSLSNGSATFAKYCAACHRIGGKGAEIGPDLDGVSVRGVERLLEDLIDPSRNVDPAFRQTSIVTKDGGILSGIVIEVGNETLEVRDVAGKVTRVPFADVAKKVASSNSLMPQGLDLAISESELYDLLAFLLAGGE
jgi:putative heme-binding domain-containing protein